MRYPIKDDPNWRECHGAGCSTKVYWRDGEYCGACKRLPERRCLDCGRTSRPGTAEYVHEEVVAPVWGVHPETFARTMREPKPIKPRTVKWHYEVAGPLVCAYCDSANIARLEFGFDRLNEDQRECPAWKMDTGSAYTRWLKGGLGDTGITLRACATCHEPLTDLKAHGATHGARLSGYEIGSRHPRVDYPDGRWGEDSSRWVHSDCADPEPVAVAA